VLQGLFKAFTMILVSEIGDKTFFPGSCKTATSTHPAWHRTPQHTTSQLSTSQLSTSQLGSA